MICCFPYNSLNVQKPMDVSQLEKSSSTVDYLQNERFCEEFCRNISENVEKTGLNGTDNGVSSEHLRNIAPGDDIEDILHEISEILAAQSGNDSACTVDSINDSRSVEDILKDAEEIVGELSEGGDNPSKRNDGRRTEEADSGSVATCGGDPGRKRKRVVIQEGPPEAGDAGERRPDDTRRAGERRPDGAHRAALYEDVLQSAVLSEQIPPPLHHNSAHNVDQQVEQLKSRINELTEKIVVYEQPERVGLTTGEQSRLALLAEEVRSQEELIATYRRENQRLCSDLTSAKECWEQTETKLVEKLRQNEQQKANLYNKYVVELGELKERLREANDTIAMLRGELTSLQEEKGDLEKVNENLKEDVSRLSCELEETRREMEEAHRKARGGDGEAARLSQANIEVTRRQTEIVRLNGLIGDLRGELEKIRLGSVMQSAADSLPGTLSQLQAALAIERDTARGMLKEKETMARELMDLRRQVKEMEKILVKRAKAGCGLPLGDVCSPDSDVREGLEKRCRELESEVAQRRAELAATQETLATLQEKYEQDLQKLEQEVRRYKKENEALSQQQQKCGRGGSSEGGGAAREDTHLLATIRGLKTELGAREKEVARLSRELEDARKTNRRLQKERTRALTSPAKTTVRDGVKEAVDNRAKGGGEPENLTARDKDYNPVHYEEEPFSSNYLRTENRTLREEIKKLEQDLISLHNKRIQDLRCLQEEHEAALREQAARHGASSVAQLQGQLYTQQMVIHHLRQHLKSVEGGAEEASLLRAERDHLEAALVEANQKVARLHQLQGPESVQYSSLLEKLEMLERRHEIREQKLQAIVRDLLVKQQQEGGAGCSSNCRDKLLNKNREICFYRAQMDNILDTLAELRWTK